MDKKRLLTSTSAMPGKSWSILAGPKVCAGFDLSKNSICHGCYAASFAYTYPKTIYAQYDRLYWWKNTPNHEVIEIMVSLIKNQKHFRVFDSGDFSCIDDMFVWYDICMQCPNTSFWIPTRVWRISEYHDGLKRLNTLNNVCIRLSNLKYDVPVPDSIKKTLDIHTVSMVSLTETNCFKQNGGNGNCGDCRDCWNKNHDCVTYKKHGKNVNWQKRNRAVKNKIEKRLATDSGF